MGDEGRIDEPIEDGTKGRVRFRRLAKTPADLPPAPRVPKPPKNLIKEKHVRVRGRAVTETGKTQPAKSAETEIDWGELLSRLSMEDMLSLRNEIERRIQNFIHQYNPELVMYGRRGKAEVSEVEAYRARRRILDEIDPGFMQDARDAYRRTFKEDPSQFDPDRYRPGQFTKPEVTPSQGSPQPPSDSSLAKMIFASVASSVAINVIDEVLKNTDVMNLVWRLMGKEKEEEKGGGGEK